MPAKDSGLQTIPCILSNTDKLTNSISHVGVVQVQQLLAAEVVVALVRRGLQVLKAHLQNRCISLAHFRSTEN